MPGNHFFVCKYMDPDIIYEVDMDGQVVWNLALPVTLGNKQSEAELLPDDTILLVSQGVDHDFKDLQDGHDSKRDSVHPVILPSCSEKKACGIVTRNE